ncbi:hypothetical protein [Asanoa sp. NPDC050611]|uniref:hypothetical protein n=1 Tax=Asanoa sp. NPDC050611 TaxID=3157098 RepID=UPI0033EA1AAB
MRRIRHIIALGAVGAIAAFALPAPALAAAPPVVGQATNDREDPTRIRVSTTADADVASVTAHLVSYSTQEVVASTSDFALASGTARDGDWVSTPLRLSAIGTFRIDVEVTDVDGNHTRRDLAGSFGYFVTTSFDQLSLNRSTVTYQNRTVTVRGRMLGTWPGSTTARPVGAGLPVQLSSYCCQFATAYTRADGTFVGTIGFDDTVGPVSVSYQYDNDHPGYAGTEQIYDLPVTVTPAPTRFTLALDRSRVDLGETVTATGTLTRNYGDGYVPLADAPVVAGWCESTSMCRFLGVLATTDAEGRYTLTVAPSSTGYLQLSHSGSDQDVFLGDALKTSRWVTVLQTSHFATFAAGRNAAGPVWIEGDLDFDGGLHPGSIPIELQFKPLGATTWQTVTTVEADSSGVFRATLDQLSAGHWRARYPGETDIFKAATSTAVRVD